MALYHFQVTQIKRSAGQKAANSVAYRAGERLYGEYYGETFDFTRKGGVVHTEIMLPPHAPREYADRATLWDAVEHAEHTKKAQLACRIDHRSYERQGIDRIPTVHEGPAVRQMEARGIRTNKGALNRWIRKTNRLLAGLREKIKALLAAIDELKAEAAKFDAENIATLLNTYFEMRNAGAYSKKARCFYNPDPASIAESGRPPHARKHTDGQRRFREIAGGTGADTRHGKGIVRGDHRLFGGRGL